ncbi:ECF transporter S component [Chakrabartyella piscis]|uniref:ECF transporter S component n=1 Tax=Chakrabartyella piscis TaxID=2918914 RepID=UPI0029588298|nr:ECF transporter S component [Chakrabartyella piscis]
MNTSTKELCLQGLFIAIVAISTMVFQIPVSATNGYIHLGDSMILLIAIFFGKKNGALAGGIGSALADILSGYAHWALFTLIIKGIMGYLVGLIGERANNKSNFINVPTVCAVVVGIVWMIFGYFVAGGILKSSFLIALASIPENAFQGISGAIVYFVAGFSLHKVQIKKLVSLK